MIKNTFHHNMSVKEAAKIAMDYGFNVETKHRHGEIVFTHPKLKGNWTISINKNEIGRGFLSWAKPVFEDGEEKKEGRFQASFQKVIAEIIAKRSREDKITTVDNVLEELNYEIPRKKASDTLIHIYKKGLSERVDIGVYKATELLLDLIPEDKPESESSQPVEAEESTPIEQETASEEAVGVEIEEIEEPKTENIVSKFEEKINQLEKLCDRLESVLKRFEETEEMKEIVEMFKEIIEKRKEK